ncbi:MAG: flagellar protein FliT [Methylobacter sp.]
MKDETILDVVTKASQLLNLTQAMLVSAKSNDWDEFRLQEQQRHAMLEMVFANQTFADSAKVHLTNVIDEILLIDKTITSLIIHQRNLAAEELHHLKRASAGNKAYQIAAGDTAQYD